MPNINFWSVVWLLMNTYFVCGILLVTWCLFNDAVTFRSKFVEKWKQLKHLFGLTDLFLCSFKDNHLDCVWRHTVAAATCPEPNQPIPATDTSLETAFGLRPLNENSFG